MPRFYHGRADGAGMSQNSAFMGPGGARWVIPEAELKGRSALSGPTSPLMTGKQRPERGCGRCGASRGWAGAGSGRDRCAQHNTTQHSTSFPRGLVMAEPRRPADPVSSLQAASPAVTGETGEEGCLLLEHRLCRTLRQEPRRRDHVIYFSQQLPQVGGAISFHSFDTRGDCSSAR